MIITNCDSTIFPFVLLKIKWPPLPPPTQAINNDRSLRVVNYICIIYLFVLAQGAPLSLSKRKVPQVPNEKQFKGIKCKRDLSVENNKQTKKKKTSTQAPVKKFCVRAGFKLNLYFWWQNWLGHFSQFWLKMSKRSCGGEMWIWRIMHGSVWPVTLPPPPRATLGTSPALRARG